MSSIPGNGKTAHAASTGGRIGATSKAAAPTAAKKPSVDKPAAAKPGVKPKLSDKDRKKLMVGIACLVVGLCVMSVYGYFNWMKKPKYTEPPLNADSLTITKFATTPEFDALSFDRQLIWMNRVGDKKKEMDELFRSGKMSQEQYQDAKSISWLGKRFKHIAEYYSRPEIRRKEYLDELINKDIIDEQEEKKLAETEKLPPRDKERVKLLVNKFPEERRQAYNAFKKALNDREKEREKEAKAAEKAAKAATRPATRPTERVPG
jgi:hypothetical protein